MEEEDKYPDEIFKRNNLTIAEKYLFAKSYVDDLKREVAKLNYKIGTLESEKSELLYINDKLISENKQVTNNIIMIKKNYENLKKLNRDLNSGLQKDEYVKRLLKMNSDALYRIKKLKKSNGELICELVQLKYNPKIKQPNE